MSTPFPSRHTAESPGLHATVRLLVLGVLAVLATMAVVAPSADAGTYTYRYCNGTTTQEGWHGYATDPGTVEITCALQAKLQGTGGANTPLGVGSVARLEWEAPANTTIASWNPDIRFGFGFFDTTTANMRLTVGGNGGAPAVSCVNEQCPAQTTGPIAIPAGTTALRSQVTCEASGASSTFCRSRATIVDNGGFITIEDPSNPTGGAVSGRIVDAQDPARAVNRTTGISIPVDDLGSGVAATSLNVDGKTVGTQENANCNAQPTFKLVPCPLHQDATVTFDSTTVADGMHTYEVAARDASGNTVRLRTGAFFVANSPIGPGSPEAVRGALTSSGATDAAKVTATFPTTAYRAPKACRSKAYERRHKTRCTSRGARSTYSGSWSTGTVTLTGRVTDAGTKVGLAGAPIAVISSVSRTGGNITRYPTTTNASGRWTVKIPRSAGSRKLAVEYRSHARDETPAASAVATTVIRARSSLRVGSSSVRRGARVRVSGTLADKTDGVPVLLQARGRGGWRTFATTATAGGGRFAASYRVARKATRGTYRFRALVRPTVATAYANSPGTSPTRTVRVR